MSPAARHLAKVALRQAAAAEDAAAAEREAAAKREAVSDKPTMAPRPELAQGDTPARLTIAALHKSKVLAAIDAAAANDNAYAPSDEALAGPYGQMRLQLREDARDLKALQSVEKKIELKRERLPAYVDWVETQMAAAKETGKAAQDDVVMTVMVWRIDAGDFFGALEIAEYALAYGLKLPPQFLRSVPVLVTEQITDAALAAPAGEPMQLGVLELTAELFGKADMPDQVKARLAKARALELLRLAENPPEGHDVASWRPAHQAEALKLFNRALQLQPNVGVKKEIKALEKTLNVGEAS